MPEGLFECWSDVGEGAGDELSKETFESDIAGPFSDMQGYVGAPIRKIW